MIETYLRTGPRHVTSDKDRLIPFLVISNCLMKFGRATKRITKMAGLLQGQVTAASQLALATMMPCTKTGEQRSQCKLSVLAAYVRV
ncbi:hypothetical protein ACU4HD_46995 [Cupriavidus basilensis]